VPHRADSGAAGGRKKRDPVGLESREVSQATAGKVKKAAGCLLTIGRGKKQQKAQPIAYGLLRGKVVAVEKERSQVFFETRLPCDRHAEWTTIAFAEFRRQIERFVRRFADVRACRRALGEPASAGPAAAPGKLAQNLRALSIPWEVSAEWDRLSALAVQRGVLWVNLESGSALLGGYQVDRNAMYVSAEMRSAMKRIAQISRDRWTADDFGTLGDIVRTLAHEFTHVDQRRAILDRYGTGPSAICDRQAAVLASVRSHGNREAYFRAAEKAEREAQARGERVRQACLRRFVRDRMYRSIWGLDEPLERAVAASVEEWWRDVMAGYRKDFAARWDLATRPLAK
jgi:hypothetical protein